jgi:hypothetical protein
MKLAISPKHTADDFKDGMTLDQKIEVFIESVRGWHLGVAKEMTDKDIANRAFAQLHIVTSYFEMIAKYREGFIGEGQSEKHFKKGVQSVFPIIDPWPQNVSDDLLTLLYKKVRNGLYHVGMILPGVILSWDPPFPMQYDHQNKVLIINPNKLIEALQNHFEEYAAELSNPSNVETRINFEKRFDSDRTP